MRSLRLLALACLSAATMAPAPARARTLDVVASFTVLADVVRSVGGEHVRVTSLVPPDGDPHEFEPAPDNARQLKGAALAFVSGDGLETWFSRLAKAAGYPGKPVVVSARIAALTMSDDGRTVADPHVWNSAANVAIWADAIATALSEADPEDAPVFRANAERYAAELRALHVWARDTFAAVPAERRKVLTSHGAFGYFARDYGVTFVSPVGLSTTGEASAGGVARLIAQIRREGVRAYFVETTTDPRLVRQIAAATGAEPGGVLYVEALSRPDGPAPTYPAMFRLNVERLAAAMRR